MAFTPGSFDIIAQIETAALDVIIDVILAQLKKDNKTTFTQQIGGSGTAVQGMIDVEITDLSIPRIRSANLAQRFKEGNTLASFQVDAELQVDVTLLTLPTFQLTETFFVRINDLALSLPVSPGGLPLGISLGFANFDLDAGGLTTLRAINPLLDLLADFISLGIRTVLTPLKLIPIPILQFADAFAKFSLFFDKDSPYLGTNETDDGLYLASDFAAANQSPSDITTVRDIIPQTSPFNVAVVLSNRPINQLIPLLLAQNHLRNAIPTAGANFVVGQAAVSFLDPATKTAHISLQAYAAARIKVRKGGFFGSLFGKKKKVTIHAYARVNLDAGLKKDLVTLATEVEFLVHPHLNGVVSSKSVLASVMMVLLQPFVIIFLPVLSQLLNLAVDQLLPLEWEEDFDGAELKLTLKKLRVQLAGGASLGLGGLSEATVKVNIDATLAGSFQLSHFIAHQINETGVDLKVGFENDSLVTRQIGPQPPNELTPPGELFLGIELARP
jgi:hypothetical protein